MTPSVLGPLGKSHWSLFRTIKECNRFCPLVLELQLQPGVVCLRNELCWQGAVGKLSQRGFSPCPPIWKFVVVGRKPSFALWDACVSGSVVPHPGEGMNCSAYLWTLLPGWSIRPDPWPLRIAWWDPCLLRHETEVGGCGWGESPPLTIIALCYTLINMSGFPPLWLCLSAYFSIHWVHFCEFSAWWIGNERENWRTCSSRSGILFFFFCWVLN